MKTHGKHASWQGANQGYKIVIGAYVQIYAFLLPKKVIRSKKRLGSFAGKKNVSSPKSEKLRSSKKVTDQKEDEMPKIQTKRKRTTLPETNIAPENGWLEYDPFLLGPGLFSGAKTLVSGRVPPGPHVLET